MVLKRWDDIPEFMKNAEVKKYYDILKKKKLSRFLKRVFDIIASFLMLILFSPAILVIAVCVKCSSPGPVFFRQRRVTSYGKVFRIFKFRTMRVHNEAGSPLVTVSDDDRITRVGRFLRKYRLDELVQLINVLRGDMSFVGTRPEVVRYVEHYTDEMKATLLMPAGITSLASIRFRAEDEILSQALDPEKMYVEDVLVRKMKYNLEEIEEFGLINDIKIMFLTVFAVFGKSEAEKEPIKK